MSETETHVRPLRAEDLDELLRLYEQFRHEDDAATSRKRLEETWREILASSWVLHLGVFAGERLLAAAHASFTPNLTRRARPYAVVENVVTDAAHRREGHGARVMNALIDACWERGCYKIMLLSGAHRPEAHRFYESLGFDSSTKRPFLLRR